MTIPQHVMVEASFLFEQLDKHPNTRAVLAEALLAAEKRGEERERERCAKVADRWKHHDTGHDIAAAIRKGTAE